MKSSQVPQARHPKCTKKETVKFVLSPARVDIISVGARDSGVFWHTVNVKVRSPGFHLFLNVAQIESSEHNQ